jgi:hypothetical protein
MRRWTKRIFILLGIIVCLGVFVYLTRDFWHDQLRAYFLGRIEVVAEHYQRLPEDIDTVEIFTLSDDLNPDDKNGFVGDSGIVETIEHKTLTGTDAKEVVDLWRYQAVGRIFQAMCFEPAYGLQFKRSGKIYFQTAICFHCNGYTLPVPPFGTVQYGFDAKNKEGQKLLETLQRHLPLPPEPKKIQPQKSVTGTTNS